MKTQADFDKFCNIACQKYLSEFQIAVRNATRKLSEDFGQYTNMAKDELGQVEMAAAKLADELDAQIPVFKQNMAERLDADARFKALMSHLGWVD
jgi:hypothetical protein